MNLHDLFEFLLFLIIVTFLVKPLGGYMEKVFSARRTALDRFCLPAEKIVYGISRVDSHHEMTVAEYATCFVLFELVNTLLLYAILRLQQLLPWFYPAYQTTPFSDYVVHHIIGDMLRCRLCCRASLGPRLK